MRRPLRALDRVVLFTGDGDFRALVRAMQMRGRRVSVVSTLKTQPPMVADELRRQADQFIDLADLEEQICRDPATRAVREPGSRDTHQRSPTSAAALDYPDDEEDEGRRVLDCDVYASWRRNLSAHCRYPDVSRAKRSPINFCCNHL